MTSNCNSEIERRASSICMVLYATVTCNAGSLISHNDVNDFCECLYKKKVPPKIINFLINVPRCPTTFTILSA